MRKFELYINEQHDDMVNHPQFTIRRSLRHVANLMDYGEYSDKWINIKDTNGNKIGAYRFKEIPDEQG